MIKILPRLIEFSLVRSTQQHVCSGSPHRFLGIRSKLFLGPFILWWAKNNRSYGHKYNQWVVQSNKFKGARTVDPAGPPLWRLCVCSVYVHIFFYLSNFHTIQSTGVVSIIEELFAACDKQIGISSFEFNRQMKQLTVSPISCDHCIVMLVLVKHYRIIDSGFNALRLRPLSIVTYRSQNS